MISVILSYNHPELTDRCVRSVLSYFSPAQVLLVHNGSETRWIKKHQENFPEVHHLILPKNLGFSGGANAGLRSSFASDLDSNWILFLTNDCTLITAPSVPAHPGIFSPLIWARKKGRIDSLGGALNLSTTRLRHLKNETANKDEYLDEYFYVPGTAFWIHRSAFTQTQGFDESLGTYWEDVELSLRAQLQGIELGTHPDTQILHGIGKTCHDNSYYTTYLYQRNRKRICLKYSKTSWEKIQIYFHLWHSWLRLAVKKISRGQWLDLGKLWNAILD